MASHTNTIKLYQNQSPHQVYTGTVRARVGRVHVENDLLSPSVRTQKRPRNRGTPVAFLGPLRRKRGQRTVLLRVPAMRVSSFTANGVIEGFKFHSRGVIEGLKFQSRGVIEHLVYSYIRVFVQSCIRTFCRFV